jgi:tetratricopeptide (TPR) repeat protein
MIVSRSRVFEPACALVALFATLVPGARSQVQTNPGSATLEGTVCDSRHRPLAGVTVTLEREGEAQPVVAHTDAEGRYRFTALSNGTYTLRAKVPGYQDASDGPLTVSSDRVNSIVLLLEPAAGSAPVKRAPHPVAYADEPTFTVAGVTDPTNLGGHGSDAVLRTKESLAKDTAALSHPALDRPKSLSSPSAGASSPDNVSAPPADNFLENQRVGKLYLEEGKPQQALPYLERAAQLKADDFGASYALALACEQSGDLARADQIVRTLLAGEARAELYALLGDISESEGRPVEAVREYQNAAQMDPSESNLFSWGAELLLHRAYVPASEVFAKGHRLFPESARLLVGLGVASYDSGSLELGARYLMEACDLDPRDPHPYLFLGKIQEAEKSEPPEMLERFKRFARLRPENAMANYYYAVGLAKVSNGSENFDRIESLLLTSVALDPHLGDAYLHLGIVHALQKDFPEAISAYQKAIENTRLPAQAHFRLAQVYRQTGKREEAAREIKLYDEISKEKNREAEREGHEIGQFVYTLRGQPAGAPALNPP